MFKQNTAYEFVFGDWISDVCCSDLPLYTIAKAMGHHTIAMTERYAHLAPDVLRDAMIHLEKQPAAAKVVNLDDRR